MVAAVLFLALLSICILPFILWMLFSSKPSTQKKIFTTVNLIVILGLIVGVVLINL